MTTFLSEGNKISDATSSSVVSAIFISFLHASNVNI